MFVRAGALVPIFISAAAVVAATHSARADEAYLCGPDKVVYVKASELEAKKKSDPCIASFYGLSLTKPEPSPDPAPAPAAAQTENPQPAEPVTFKSLTEADVPERARHKLAQASVAPAPSAAPATGYRTVRIINAASAGEQWYRHAR